LAEIWNGKALEVALVLTARTALAPVLLAESVRENIFPTVAAPYVMAVVKFPIKKPALAVGARMLFQVVVLGSPVTVAPVKATVEPAGNVVV
jgi:hypothetical protein